MDAQEAKTQLLDEVLIKLRELAGIDVQVLDREFRKQGMQIDAVLKVGNTKLYAEIKKWAQHANRAALLHQLQQLPQPALLVADYVNPKMAVELREEGIQFADTVGNVYLDLKNRLVYVVGNKAPAQVKPGTRRDFNAAGLKIIFSLLRKDKFLQATYREIAQEAGVALGTVGGVLNDLKAAGFLIQQGKAGPLEMEGKEALFRKWVDAYLERLQPKQLIGRYIALDPLWWENVDIRQFGAVWGGEVAAEKLLHLMRPKFATVFLPKEKLIEFIQMARLRKFVAEQYDEPQGLVEIYQPFWQVNHKEELAHPMIIYANLIATHDPRAREMAEILYEQFIAERLR